MAENFSYLDYTIQPIDHDLEVNFLIFKGGNYICRLTPCLEGFNVSKLDKALGNEPDNNLIQQLTRHILNIYA